MNKALVIYHKNCLDGFGAAFAAWKSAKVGQVTFVPMDYNERDKIYQYELIDKDVYVLDFSFSREVTGQIIAKAAKFVWLDHHKTAFEEHGKFFIDYTDIANNFYVKLSANNKSGAVLAWEYFHPNAPVPGVIAHIDDRDRWQWKLEGTKEVTSYLSSIEQDFEVWDNIIAGYEESSQTLINYGRILNEYFTTQLSRAIDATKESCNILGNAGLCCNLPPMFASEAGNILAKETGTYGATWFKDKEGNIKWSLRSIGDFDVSAIAKQFGGGGHKNAAGFVLRPASGGTEPGVKLWHT